jgi:signal transduction histidine kinase
MLSERLDTWLRDHALLVDVLFAFALVAVIGLVALATQGPVALALTTALLTPLAWRRRAPALSAALVCSAGLAQLLAPSPPSTSVLAADVAVPLSVYAVTSYGPRWAASLGLASGLVGALLAPLSWMPGAPTSDRALLSGFLATTVVSAWAFGSLRRVRLEQLQALRDRARLLEVERDQQARLAVSTERARIAREMHDIVAHSLAVVIAQADGGRYAAGSSPEAAREALTTIGDTGRRALAEMRRLLGVLRSDAAADGSEPAGAALGPQPGACDVGELVEQVRSGGLAVRLEVLGSPRALSPGVDLAVYRIVQEGLTNVLKHAGPSAAAQVLVRWRQSEVQVEVLDDGRGAGAPAPGGGHGLIGMRERVSLFGGWLATGPRVSGGYAVRAVLPEAGAVLSAATTTRRATTR